jgi:hypothetical protein
VVGTEVLGRRPALGHRLAATGYGFSSSGNAVASRSGDVRADERGEELVVGRVGERCEARRCDLGPVRNSEAMCGQMVRMSATSLGCVRYSFMRNTSRNDAPRASSDRGNGIAQLGVESLDRVDVLGCVS